MDARAKYEKCVRRQRPNGWHNPSEKPGPVLMDHVLLALGETNEEREQRIRSLFGFFDAASAGYLDYEKIEAGLSVLQIPSEYKCARDLLNACDANKDGRVDYQEFKRYMDDKELELSAFCRKSCAMRFSGQALKLKMRSFPFLSSE